MACHLAGAKPLSEPMMVSLLTHICVTRPQWVNRTSLVKKRLQRSLSLTNFLCKSDLAEILFHFIQNYGAEYGFHMYCMSRQWSCYKITRIKNYSKVVFASGLSFEWKIVSEMCICVVWIDLPVLQIPQCTCSLSHNAPDWNRNAHFCSKVVYCGIWDRCIVEFEIGLLLCCLYEDGKCNPCQRGEDVYWNSQGHWQYHLPTTVKCHCNAVQFITILHMALQ